MQITFHGSAQTVTGSKHLLTLDNGKKILMDCGMFQGHGTDSDVLNRNFGFNPAEIDYVILSHAHIDHSGLLPFLVKQGFKGRIISTPATRDLCKVLLLDSAHIQESDAAYLNKNRRRKNEGRKIIEPLYNTEDAYLALSMFRTVKYRTEFEVCKGVSLYFTDAGHIIGSAAVHLDIMEHGKLTKISFSGDVGRYGDLILKSPEVFRQADYILLESTYGDSLHEAVIPTEDVLLKIILDTCVNRKGKLIIPAFSVGRTQELLYHLNSLSLQGRLPLIPVYVDSPLSEKATLVVKSHPWNFNKKVQEVMEHDDDPFDFPLLRFIEDVEESKALNFKKEPCIIISASGMAEAGRVKHHIKNNIQSPQNTILLVGHSEPGSLAGRLKAGAEIVSIFGDKLPVIAKIASINSMSAHGDQKDLLRFISSQKPALLKKIFLVHGDFQTQLVFKEKLLEVGYRSVEIPKMHEGFVLGG
ncbi:MAG TPA: MBL fold metallo-hydrolase [Sphingobacteriaceae bacterium]|nr:MBL fold metallo-hydrolase [Sphingobacteriaceae bacterium]